MSSARFLDAGPALCKGTAKSLGMLLVALLLASCATHTLTPSRGYNPSSSATGAPYSGVVEAHLTQVSWDQVEGWQEDTLIGAAAALRANCLKLARQPDWSRACSEVGQIDELDPTSARGYFERYFTPFQLANDDGSVRGLVTGYYEPELHGSRSRHDPYLYPLYRWPAGYARNATLPARATLVRSGMLNG